MTQAVSTRDHKRKKTLVFDPIKKQKEAEANPEQHKKRVSAYARVSTDQDCQQSSYEAQIEYYSNYIKSNPSWEFVNVYADEGITGTNYKRRDGFNKMVTDALDGKMDLILTKSISRFARNTVDALTITRKLKAEGIEVYFEKENISSMDSHAELIFTIMSSIAQEESRSISENVRWGLQRNMEAGKVALPWKSVLGYERGPDGLPKVVEEEASIVRRIYRDYLNGMSKHAIAATLTKEGIKTPCGKDKWSPESINCILTSEKYIGDAILQKTYTIDFLSKEKRINRGERRQWYIHDSHDAIVSKEAQKLVMSELKIRGGKHGLPTDSPFNRKVFCGKCGNPMGYRRWDLEKKVEIKKWTCGKCLRSMPLEELIAVKESQLKRAFLIAATQLLTNYSWAKEEYKTEFFPLFSDTGNINLDETATKITQFDGHALITLVESIKIMPDRSILFKFRNGRKEVVML